jgi:selenocysteine-specific elongation factor
MVIFGTAGHIDHGKTALVYALTGMNADRLPEEKKRGMTIDLGFAWLETSRGEKIGMIDVPGHENYIKNMITGMTSVDAFILVVDAKEGWKPQTEEHFQIIRLLNIQYGIIVITKTDLVSSERTKEVRQEIEEKITGDDTLQIPILSFSNKDSDRIYQLKEQMERLSVAIPEKKDIDKPRLFIDRVFEIKGSGTVVTGTLINGNLYRNQTVSLFPLNRKVRLRQLQSYGSPVEKAIIGSRVALNLSGVKKEELHRGDLIYGNQKVQYGKAIDVMLTLPVQKKPYLLKNGSEVDFISHTKLSHGRVVFNRKELKSGEQSYAQIRFEGPLCLMPGDYFILRLPGINVTIGGGRILDALASRHSFNHPSWSDWLDKRKNLDIKQLILTELQKVKMIKREEMLVNSPYSEGEIEQTLEELYHHHRLFLIEDWVIEDQFWTNQINRVTDYLQRMHQDYVLKAGFPLLQLTNHFSSLPDKLFDGLIAFLVKTEKIKVHQGEVSSFEHTIVLSTHQKEMMEDIIAYIEHDPEQLPTEKELKIQFPKDQELIPYFIQEGIIMLLEEQIVMTPEIYRKMKDKIVDYLKKNKKISIGQVRELLHISRKYIIPLLTKMDEEGITLRREGQRVLKEQETSG